jgi:hypothetical protein
MRPLSEGMWAGMRWPNWLRWRPERTVRTRPFEEGLLLAEYATRMAVKNHIVIDTIQGGHDFEPERHIVIAAEMLRELAMEQGEAADRMDGELAAAEGQDGDARHPHDYRDADVANLRLRRDAAADLATSLRAKADSADELLTLVERGRRDAWDEVGHAIEAGLDAFSGAEALKADYEREKPGRLTLFIWRDLAQLREERTGY